MVNWGNMSSADWNKVNTAIRKAAEETMAAMGIEAFRQTSWFPSSNLPPEEKATFEAKIKLRPGIGVR